MTRVRLNTQHDLREWEVAGIAGQRPGRAPYGLEHLAEKTGALLTQWQPPEWLQGRRATGARRWIEGKAGMSIVRPLLSVRGMSRVDIVLAILEKEGYLHALLRRARIRPWSRVPVVYLACWLADEAQGARGLRLAFYRAVARSADQIIYWSTNQRRIYTDILGVRPENLLFVPFGTELDFYHPDAEGPVAASPEDHPYLFAAGRDRGRDYQTLFAAVAGLPIQLRVACPFVKVEGLEIPENVILLGEVGHTEYRDLIRKSMGVVVVSHPGFAYPTGQTVLLNAMACGVPVVVTASDALDDYVRDGGNALVAEPGDAGSLRDQLSALLSNPDLACRLVEQGLRDVRRDFSADRMWGHIAAALDRTAAGKANL